MEKTGIGIIGLGLWGEAILDSLLGVREAKVMAVASRSSQRAKEIAQKYGAKKSYTDCWELAKDPDIQIVIVATEEDRHVEPTLAALEAGKHVFLEKPIASTLEDADRIIQAAEASQSMTMVGHIFRFDGRHSHAKELISEGKIGKVASFFAKHNVIKKNFDIYRRVPLHMVSSVHEFDLARWYLEDEPAEVYCVGNNALGEKDPDSFWITVKFRKGVVAAFQTVWLLPEAAPVWLDIDVEIMGTQGFIDLNTRDAGMTIWSPEGTKFPMYGMLPVLRGIPYGALRNELEYFVRCVQDSKRPDVLSLKDAREALHIAVLADESFRTGKVVKA
jgi:predicted dehydrogenase